VTAALGLLLTPGAGADRDQPALVAIDERAQAAGVDVVRMDFPYRKAGRRAPDRPPVLIRSILEEVEPLAARVRRLVLGGRSMGGRMCSMAVAEGLPAAGLVLISYPLHPPGKPESRRTEHFPNLKVPCLFVSGTRDTFGTPAELEEATTTIPGAVTHHWIDGKDHGMRGTETAVAQIVVGWLGETGLLSRTRRATRRTPRSPAPGAPP
jgi:predicted alpha/beta-hydrolase family hydrolase